MRRNLLVVASAIGVAASVVLGCGDSKNADNRCFDLVVPGTRVSMPGIQLAIRNPQSQPVASNTTVTAVNGVPAPNVSNNQDSLTLNVYLSEGTYSVRLAHPFYRDTTLSNLVVVAGDCGSVQTTKSSVVLQPAAGAPQVRSVTVFGADFLATPGTQARLVAIVDADAGVSRAVTWRLSDTTLARIDQTGLVTAKCSLRGGADTVTSTSIVDSKVSGIATFGVGASGSC